MANSDSQQDTNPTIILDNNDIIDLSNDISKAVSKSQGTIEYWIKEWAQRKKDINFFKGE